MLNSFFLSLSLSLSFSQKINLLSLSYNVCAYVWWWMPRRSFGRLGLIFEDHIHLLRNNIWYMHTFFCCCWRSWYQRSWFSWCFCYRAAKYRHHHFSLYYLSTKKKNLGFLILHTHKDSLFVVLMHIWWWWNMARSIYLLKRWRSSSWWWWWWIISSLPPPPSSHIGHLHLCVSSYLEGIIHIPTYNI